MQIVEQIDIVNEENYRRKKEVCWELHAWGDVFKKSCVSCTISIIILFLDQLVRLFYESGSNILICTR